MTKSKRDNFNQTVRLQLRERVALFCSKPGCRVLTVGASEEEGKVARVGVAAHITAAAPGGPRYDESLTSQQRKSFDNGIWLCSTHADEIDADKCRYSVELIRQWKEQAEQYAQEHRGKPPAFELTDAHETEPTLLSLPPLNPQTFIGRDADLTAVHQQLFNGDKLLLLVNGEGGIGKTTLASRYYHQFKHLYTHVAWVFAENNLASALLTIAERLDISFKPNATDEQRLNQLIIALAALPGPCLLIIDNANDITALKQHYNALLRCSNFHILLTTRVTEFAKVPVYKIEQLGEQDAIELFTIHYDGHDSRENPLLKRVCQQVGYNTLVIELLAKNLANINRYRNKYSLQQLFDDLSAKGLFNLSQNSEVDTAYHADTSQLRQENVCDIICAMYKLGELTQNQQQLLSIFALLPAEHIGFETLLDLAVLNDEDVLEQTLTELHQHGWIEHDKSKQSFRTSPVIQATVLEQNQASLIQHSELLIEELIDKLDYQGGTGHIVNTSYETAGLYSRYGEVIISHLGVTEYNHGVLLERLGSYYETTGDIYKALGFYQLCEQSRQQLYQQQLENFSFINGLAVAYSKLGNTYTSLGDLDKALEFQLKDADLSEQLHQQQPENVEFTYGLAVAYSKLGNTYTSLDDLDKALDFQLKDADLSERLHNQQPQNLSFTSGLAIAYEKLGNTYTRLDDLDKALDFYQQRAELSAQLHHQQPQNVSFKNGLAVAYSKLADTYSSLGDLDKALGFYQQYEQLRQQLHNQQPQNVSFKNGLAVAYAKLGQFYYQENDQYQDLVKATSYFKQAHQLWLQLTTLSPNMVEFQRNLTTVEKYLKTLESSSN